ncbi:MAG TPA: hypothetical protein PK831_03150 [Candidatus Magasanikbacteria bacterium]|jgi:nitroreductase|nr:hypothetical protein [Candidatus Magasanikbacteria bacterium]HQF57468.1 hypothetical protein [Candidatus Magasanikbacteria bacterium]
MKKEIILNILKAAVRAPSGDNSQPWRFEVSNNNNIKIYNLPEKDNPIFNYKQRGSHIAHGALIENIIIAAKENGMNVKVNLFPQGTSSDFIAEIDLLPDQSIKKDPLFEFIFKRAINRKHYKDKLLTDEEKKFIFDDLKEIDNGKIILIEDKNKVEKLGKAFSINEVVMLENKFLHKYFFNDVRWTDEQEREHKTGLYAKTMELKPPELAVFKILSHWRINKILCKLGIAKFIAKENAKGYGTGTIGAIIMKDGSPESYIKAGMIMQRIWLKATQLGLSLHPVTGVVFMMMSINENKNEAFSDVHVDLLKKAYFEIKDNLGINEGEITITFKIGDGGKSSGYSSRLEPNITFLS